VIFLRQSVAATAAAKLRQSRGELRQTTASTSRGGREGASVVEQTNFVPDQISCRGTKFVSGWCAYAKQGQPFAEVGH